MMDLPSKEESRIKGNRKFAQKHGEEKSEKREGTEATEDEKCK